MSSSKKLKSSRGYCRYCETIVWLDNMKCSNEHIGLNSENQKIDPVLPSQVFSILFCSFWFSDYSYLMGLSQSAVLLFNANNGSVKLNSEWCDWSILWHYIKDNRDCSSVCCCLAGSLYMPKLNQNSKDQIFNISTSFVLNSWTIEWSYIYFAFHHFQVVEYLLDDSISFISSSESESDSDTEAGSFSRLWAYRRPLTRTQDSSFI